MQRIIFVTLSIVLAFTNIFPMGTIVNFAGIPVHPQQVETGTPTPTFPVDTETPTPVNSSTPEILPTATEGVTATPPLEFTETATATLEPTATETPTPEATVGVSNQSGESLQVFLDVKASPRFLRQGGNINLHWKLDINPVESGGGYIIRIQAPAYLMPAKGEPFARNAEGMLESTEPLGKSNGIVKLDVLDQVIEGDSTAILVQLFKDGVPISEQRLELAIAHPVSRANGGEVNGGQNKRVRVIFPPDALPEDVDVVVMDLGWEDGNRLAEESGKPWHPFKVEAYNKKGEEVNHFNREITIEYAYDPMEYAGNESVLFLSYFDELTQTWMPLPGDVDMIGKRIIARSDHLTVLNPNYSDWQAAMLPSMAGWQVSSFTGAAAYSIPLTLPAGPGGFQPSLELSYNSQVIDNASVYTQASWVGMGWTLDVPYIQRDNHGTWDNVDDDLFYIHMNGVSGLLMKGTDGYWHTEDVSFARITINNGSVNDITSWWEVSLEDGTRYIFGSEVDNSKAYADIPVCWAKDGYVVGNIPWKWAVSKIISRYGQEIHYLYDRYQSLIHSYNCGQQTGLTVDGTFSIYPKEIRYPQDSYVIKFNTQEMRSDFVHSWDLHNTSTLAAYMKKRLGTIQIEHNPGNNPNFTNTEIIRKYSFIYANDALSGIDNTIIWPGYKWNDDAPIAGSPYSNKTLTLIRFQEQVCGENQVCNDLPPYTFNYGTGETTDGVNYPNGDAQHLRWAENGYGGRIEFTYSPWSCNNSDCSYAWNSTIQNDNWKKLYGTDGDLGTTIKEYKYWYSWHNKTMAHPGANYELHMMTERRYGSGTVPLVVSFNNGTGSTTMPRVLLNSTVTTNAGWTEYNVKYHLDGNSIIDTAMVQTQCGSGETGCHLFQFQHRYLPTFYRVTAMKTIDQQSGTSYTTSYSYSGGKMNETLVGQNKTWMQNPPYTEFRGFNQVTETAPDGHKTIYTFWQGEERDATGAWIGKHLQGRTKEIRVTTANENEVLQRKVFSYECTYGDLAPYIKPSNFWVPIEIEFYWVRMVSEEEYAHAGNLSSFIARKTTYTYDPSAQGNLQLGNLTNRVEFEWKNGGWQALRGVKTTFFPNVSASKYITGLPGLSQTFACSGSGCNFAAAPTRETQYIYDSNANYSTPPAVGYLSRTRQNMGSDQFIDTLNFYDAWGNLISTTKYRDYGTAAAFATTGAQTTTFCYGGGQPAGCPDDGHHTYLLWTQDAFAGHPKTTFTYNLRTGNLITETGMNNDTTTAYYDDYGRLVKVVRPGDTVDSPTFRAEYIYQSPVWTSGPFGFSTRVTQKIDADTQTVMQKYYNGLGQLLQTRLAGAVVNGASQDLIVDYGYDAMGRLSRQAMPRAVASTGGAMAAQNFSTVVQTGYDALGRVISIQQPDGTSTGYTYTLSENTLVTTIVDALGNATLQKTDAFGRLLSVLPPGYPANPGVSYTYDAFDRLTNAAYGDAVTTISYDDAGRKTAMSDPDMGSWAYQYDALGNLIRQTDAIGQRTCLFYDDINRLQGRLLFDKNNPSPCPESNPDVKDVSFSYDSGASGLGYRTGMSDSSGSTTWTYDERGRVITETKNITGAGTFLTQWAYYSNDAVYAMTYPGGNSGQAGEVVTYEYNPQALLEKMHSTEMNYVPEIVYDAAGRVEKLSMGGTASSPILQKVFTFNPWNTQGGRLQSSFVEALTPGSDLQTLTYTYDVNGNITQMVDARQSGSETLSYQYDSLNRLRTVNGAYSEMLGYDNNGRITNRTMPDETRPVFMDSFSNQDLVNWTWSSYATAPFDHENNQVVKSMGNTNTYATGFTRTAAIDQETTVNLRFKLSQTGSNARFYFGMSPVSCSGGGTMSVGEEATTMILPESILLTLTPPPSMCYYDQAGVVERSGSLYFFIQSAGNLELESRTLLLNSVQANTWYQLSLRRGSGSLSSPLAITVSKESDPGITGTVTQVVSGVDWHFRHTIQSGTVYIDDFSERGEIVDYAYGSQPHAVRSITSGGQTIRQYNYDDNGNMTQRTEGSDTYTFAYDLENRLVTGAKNGVTLASYTYDGDGKRVKVVEGGLTTYYIGDYYEWREGSTTTEVKYYYAAGQRIAMRTNSVLTWLLGDHLGSATITATENGTLASEQKYTAWGQTRSGTLPTDRQYTGQINEPQLGIYFYNARFYDPYLARFIQADSIIPQPGSPLAWDRYSYTGNNPIVRTDPSGHANIDMVDGKGCSSSEIDNSPACILQLHGYDSEATDDSLESWLSRHPDYNPVEDELLQGPDAFIVASALSRVNCWSGSNADCALIVGLGMASSYAMFGMGPDAPIGYTPGRNKSFVKDAIGDPDCTGCGFQLITDPALRQSAQNTLDLIDQGGPFPFKKDGNVFKNNGNPLPASASPSYYREYTIPEPGATNRGAARYVVGNNGEVYLTLDHYAHFIRIR